MAKDKVIYGRLRVDIYTIGYVPEGESIIFVIYSGSDPLYVGVIDSYEKDNINYTQKWLDKLGITQINMLCWSHPDSDHSKGFDKLFKFLDSNSVFVIPSNVVEYRDKIEGQFHDIWEFINNEQLTPKAQKAKKYVPINCHIQYVAENTYICNLPCLYFVYGITKYQFSLRSFLPISQNTYIGEFNDKNMEENGFSVGLLLQIGEFCAIFASDCHDNYIKRIDQLHFSDYCDFLKIPHHGSKTSTKIIDRFSTAISAGYNITVASVTKKTVKLPNDDAIRQYKKGCDNILYTDEIPSGNNYGISIVSVDITDKKFDYKYDFEGNAGFKFQKATSD